MTWIYILDISKGLLTPIIAGVVAYIAYQQHKTNRDKLRFELYDKRLKVFHSLENFLGDISREGDCTHGRMGQYCAEIGESRFLFDKDITDYLEKIYTEAGNLHDLEHEIKHIDILSKEKKESIINKREDVFHRLTGQIKESQTRFEKYLGFRQSEYLSERRIMNFKSGFERIAWVLSIVGFLFWVGLDIYLVLTEGWDPDFWIGLSFAFLSFAAIWVVYYVVLYIVKGFCNGRSVNEQKR